MTLCRRPKVFRRKNCSRTRGPCSNLCSGMPPKTCLSIAAVWTPFSREMVLSNRRAGAKFQSSTWLRRVPRARTYWQKLFRSETTAGSKIRRQAQPAPRLSTAAAISPILRVDARLNAISTGGRLISARRSHSSGTSDTSRPILQTGRSWDPGTCGAMVILSHWICAQASSNK